MAIKLTNALRTRIIDNLFASHFAWSLLSVYTGSAPSTADEPPSGTLLVGTGEALFGGAANGTANLSTYISYGGSVEGGTAGYARLCENNASTICIQGNVGTAATCDFIINKGTFGVSEEILLLSATVIQPAE